MHARAVLYPFEVNHTAGKVLRSVLKNFEFFIGDEISVRAPAMAPGAQRLGLNGRVIEGRATAREERSSVVGQPKRREDVDHLLGQSPREIAFRHHERHILRYSILVP